MFAIPNRLLKIFLKNSIFLSKLKEFDPVWSETLAIWLHLAINLFNSNYINEIKFLEFPSVGGRQFRQIEFAKNFEEFYKINPSAWYVQMCYLAEGLLLQIFLTFHPEYQSNYTKNNIRFLESFIDFNSNSSSSSSSKGRFSAIAINNDSRTQ